MASRGRVLFLFTHICITQSYTKIIRTSGLRFSIVLASHHNVVRHNVSEPNHFTTTFIFRYILNGTS